MTYRNLVTLPLLGLVLTQCIKRQDTNEPIGSSQVASVIIGRIADHGDSTELLVQITEDKTNGQILVDKRFTLSDSSDQADMNLKLKPGAVVIRLDSAKKDGTVMLSTTFCSQDDQKSTKATLVAGANRISPYVCDKAQVTQEPRPTPPPTAQRDTDTPPEQWTTFKNGYATRYWDCCKPHCAWPTNVQNSKPVVTCDINNKSNGDRFNEGSGCDNGNAFTCFTMVPWAVSSTLSYGYAAVPGGGDSCGKCYELRFTGDGHHGANEGAARLKGKRLIVQATNIGWDVGGGQFDILTPGGGVGAFNACSRQWGINASDLGAQYGGILTTCREKLGWNAAHEDNKSCVRAACNRLFSASGREDLLKGCMWFVDWYEVADNPNLQYNPVDCPKELRDISGM